MSSGSYNSASFEKRLTSQEGQSRLTESAGTKETNDGSIEVVKQTMLEKGEVLLKKPMSSILLNTLEMILNVTALLVWLFHVKYEKTLWVLICSNALASFILIIFTLHVEFFRTNVKKIVKTDDTCIYYIPYHWKLLIHLSLIGRTMMILANMTITSTTNYFSLITTSFLLIHILHCFLNFIQIYYLIQWIKYKE